MLISWQSTFHEPNFRENIKLVFFTVELITVQQ